MIAPFSIEPMARSNSSSSFATMAVVVGSCRHEVARWSGARRYGTLRHRCDVIDDYNRKRKWRDSSKDKDSRSGLGSSALPMIVAYVLSNWISASSLQLIIKILWGQSPNCSVPSYCLFKSWPHIASGCIHPQLPKQRQIMYTSCIFSRCWWLHWTVIFTDFPGNYDCPLHRNNVYLMLTVRTWHTNRYSQSNLACIEYLFGSGEAMRVSLMHDF